jgi:hypothetical protein
MAILQFRGHIRRFDASDHAEIAGIASKDRRERGLVPVIAIFLTNSARRDARS